LLYRWHKTCFGPTMVDGNGQAALPQKEISVEELLRIAYATELGKKGHSLAGHTAIGNTDITELLEKGQGSSLLYGELLPEAVPLLLAALVPSNVGQSKGRSAGPLLELGMGIGKVALHAFLIMDLNVYGIELAPSRWALADAALQRLATSSPHRFSYETDAEKRCSRLVALADGRTCDFVCGSLLDTPVNLVNAAPAVVMEVCMPKDVQRLACALLQQCNVSARVICFAPLHGLVPDCRLGPVTYDTREGATSPTCGDGQGGLVLPASWNPHGHGFAFYELCDSAEVASRRWAQVALQCAAGRVAVDQDGCPSRARRMKYTDEVFGPSQDSCYSWGPGDEILVGFSWLPFPDLGEPPDDGAMDADGPDGVSWMHARVLSLDDRGCATICYTNDGTVEEQVHPERIRKQGHKQPRLPPVMDWGTF